MNNTEKLSTSDTQDTGHNKYQSKQKGQSGMNNRETLTTSHTQDKINTMYPMLSVSLCCSSCLKNFVCKLKPIIIESYTESNESLKNCVEKMSRLGIINYYRHGTFLYVFSCVICFHFIHFILISTANALFLSCLPDYNVTSVKNVKVCF